MEFDLEVSSITLFVLSWASWVCLGVAGWALHFALGRFTLGFHSGLCCAVGLVGWTFCRPKAFYGAMSTNPVDIALALR